MGYRNSAREAAANGRRPSGLGGSDNAEVQRLRPTYSLKSGKGDGLVVVKNPGERPRSLLGQLLRRVEGPGK